MVKVVCAAWLAPGPSAGTPREPSAASVASYVEFADRKNDVVDAPAPPDVLKAAVAVLAAWRWQTRPVAVMGLDSRSHPLLIGSLVDSLAGLGRMTNLGILRYRDGRRPVTAANSAYRVSALHDSWVVPEIVPPDGPVLLVDDVTDTGWTMTMGARVLRRAGVPEVLPFALASVN